jgi:hypothetical protein
MSPLAAMSVQQSLLSVVVLSAVLSHAWAQTSPQENIERGVQARTAAQRELTMRLDLPRGAPPPPPPAELLRSVTLPTPGTQILERQPAPELSPKPTVIPSAPPVVTGATLLEDSQRRRQAALQADNARLPLDDPARLRSTQIQGLTFERETRAQDLGSAIMRSSEQAVGR